MYITDIKKGNKMLSSLYVDGELFAKIDNEVLIRSGLKVGSSVDDEILNELKYDSDYKRSKDKSLYLLSFRDHSRKELIDKLKRDYSVGVAEKSARRMEELGLINDDNFAKRYARELLFNKHFSKRRAEFELSQKGIDKDKIYEILSSIEYDAVEQIKLLINKKYKLAHKDEKVKKRAIAFLQRYGYSWEEIRQVFDT